MRVPARPGPGDHAGHGRTGDGVKRAGPSSRRERAGLEVRNQSSLPWERRRGRLREGLGEAVRPWRFTNPSRVRGRGAARPAPCGLPEPEPAHDRGRRGVLPRQLRGHATRSEAVGSTPRRRCRGSIHQ